MLFAQMKDNAVAKNEQTHNILIQLLAITPSKKYTAIVAHTIHFVQKTSRAKA